MAKMSPEKNLYQDEEVIRAVMREALDQACPLSPKERLRMRENNPLLKEVLSNEESKEE